MSVQEDQALGRRLANLAAGPLVALELLSVLRLRRVPLLTDRLFGASQAWFPAVGLLFGLALLGLDEALDGYLPSAVLGWLLAGMLVGISGGLHVDGLADTADGVFGGRSREERLAIMRDGSIGAFGAAAVLLALGLKATAFASLTSLRAETLILTPMLGRWAMIPAIAAYPYAREQGLGKAFHAAALPWPAAFATATMTAAMLGLFGPKALVLLVLSGGLALALGYGMKQSLGGLTGDTYGAIVEACEVAVLLALLAMETHGWLG